MSKYGSVLYNQSVYGQKSRLSFSVEPFSAVALDYTTIELTWSAPIGGYTAFRLVRNQDGFSETVEDGAIVYEEFGIEPTSGSVSITTLLDGAIPNTPPLVGGRFAYYQVWLLKSSDKVWYTAGNTYTLVPNAHPTYGPDKEILLTTHDKFMNLLPRMFTSSSNNPIDEVSSDTDIYRYLQGFSFTFDEFLSMADSLLPNVSGTKASPLIIGVQADQLGLTREPTISIKHQKKMIREAIYMYSRKGTFAALSTLIESITGYDSAVQVSPNLMLSNADSTFYKETGFWLPVGDCSVSVEDVNPVTTESGTIDKVYSGKVTVGTPGASIVNGSDYPITRGIPVVAETEYSFSFYSQVASSTGSIVPSIYWYNSKGVVLSSSTGTSVPVTTIWDGNFMVATAPVDAVYASTQFTFESAGTYYLDMLQVAESSNTTYSEARAVTVFLNPTKNNYLSNPSFEAANSAWTIVSGATALVTTDVPNYVLVGNTVLEVTPGVTEVTTSTAEGISKANSYVSFSVYGRTLANTDTVTVGVFATTTLQVSSPQVVSNVATLSLNYGHPVEVGQTITVSDLGTPFDGEQLVTAVSESSISYEVVSIDIVATPVFGTATLTISDMEEAVLTTVWSRAQVNLFVPEGFVADTSSLAVSISGSFVNTVQFDGAQLEPNYRATDYFDGDYGTERDALWSSIPNNSPSYLYPNKLVNVSRLSEEIVNFLPQDTPYFIYSHSGTEASGIS